MTDTFVALSDPTRRLLLDRLSEEGGLTLSDLSEDLPMTRQAVAKHLAVLESAELVASGWDLRALERRIAVLDPIDAGLTRGASNSNLFSLSPVADRSEGPAEAV